MAHTTFATLEWLHGKVTAEIYSRPGRVVLVPLHGIYVASPNAGVGEGMMLHLVGLALRA
jgi:hypothetical protein